jgi:hypothetical protein
VSIQILRRRPHAPSIHYFRNHHVVWANIAINTIKWILRSSHFFSTMMIPALFIHARWKHSSFLRVNLTKPFTSMKTKSRKIKENYKPIKRTRIMIPSPQEQLQLNQSEVLSFKTNLIQSQINEVISEVRVVHESQRNKYCQLLDLFKLRY